MNIIKMRQDQREGKLIQIEASINKALFAEQDITYEKTLMAITANLSLSKQTAIEYLEVVMFRMGLEREDLDKGKLPSAKVQANRQLKSFLK